MKAIFPRGRVVHRIDESRAPDQWGGVTLCGLRVAGPCFPFVEGKACRRCQKVIETRDQAQPGAEMED